LTQILAPLSVNCSRGGGGTFECEGRGERKKRERFFYFNGCVECVLCLSQMVKFCLCFLGVLMVLGFLEMVLNDSLF
jgi:hypothetical protein